MCFMCKINEYNSNTLDIGGGLWLYSRNLKFRDFFGRKEREREKKKEIEKRRGLLTKAMC